MTWYRDVGPEGDIVISTRIRLARNLKDYPFPERMNAEQRHKVMELVSSAIINGNSAISKTFEFMDMEKISRVQAMSLAERHIISPEFAEKRGDSGLLLNKDESISIMINEEDHIRIQAMRAGLDFDKALDNANKIDDILDENLQYAFDEKLGFLTECPTNLGTGLRASVMLHLPALHEVGAVSKFAATVNKIGMAVRGTFGEGSEAKGAFYQLSNQVTLGISEAAAVEGLNSVAVQVIYQERVARDSLKKSEDALADRAWRAYGILKNARLLSADEFMNLSSDLRLGITTEVIGGIGLDTLNGLIADVWPASMMITTGKSMDQAARDKMRADIVRERLEKK
jgi:protein arginine kinase